jgi:hypothetical protein
MPRWLKGVLLVICIATLFSAGYGLFVFSQRKASKAVPAGIVTKKKNSVAAIKRGLRRERLSEAEVYVIAKAAEEWPEDPFYKEERRSAEAEDEEKGSAEPVFRYSGYLEIGRKKLAVINGREYVLGQELEGGGYIVREIHQNKVVIEGKVAGESITVPYREKKL